jgi:hypothetical protein
VRNPWGSADAHHIDELPPRFEDAVQGRTRRMRSLRRARWPPRVARLYCAKLALIPRSLSAMPDPRPTTAVSLSGVLEAVSDSADCQFPLKVRLSKKAYHCRYSHRQLRMQVIKGASNTLISNT